MSNLMSQFLLATVTLSGIAAGAIVMVTAIRPEHDNSAIIATIVSVCAPSLLALGALLRGQANSTEMAETKRNQEKRAEEIKKNLEETTRKQEEIIKNSTLTVTSHLAEQDKEIKQVKDVLVKGENP